VRHVAQIGLVVAVAAAAVFGGLAVRSQRYENSTAPATTLAKPIAGERARHIRLVSVDPGPLRPPSGQGSRPGTGPGPAPASAPTAPAGVRPAAPASPPPASTVPFDSSG
jgi:hypothetical protein